LKSTISPEKMMYVQAPEPKRKQSYEMSKTKKKIWRICQKTFLMACSMCNTKLLTLPMISAWRVLKAETPSKPPLTTALAVNDVG